MLDQTIHRLYETGVLKVCDFGADINSYTYEYMGRLVKQRVTIDPRLIKEDLVDIARRAISGNIADMVTVAMLYNIGYGLPYSQQLAIAWSQYATLTSASISFDDARKLLKKHAYNAPYESYPDSLIVPCMDAIGSIEEMPVAKKIPAGTFVTPEFDGISVFSVYRNVPGESPNLYAVFYKVDDDFYIAPGKITELGILPKLGPLPFNATLLSYEPFGQNAMYVVAGFICASADVVSVFDDFLKSTDPIRPREAFNNEEFEEALRIAERDYDRTDRLLKRYLENGESVPAKHRNEHIQNRESVARRKAELAASNPEKDYQQYIERLPISRLKYVQTGAYRWNFTGLKTVNLQKVDANTYESETHKALRIVGAIAGVDLQETVKTLEEVTGLTIKSLTIQQSLNSGMAADVTRYVL